MLYFFKAFVSPEEPDCWWNKPDPWSIFLALAFICLAGIMCGTMIFMLVAGEMAFAGLALVGAVSAAYLACALLVP